MTDTEIYAITSSEEYKTYIAALGHLACCYVVDIRKQFAAKAIENFQNETIRALVIAYGEERKKLEEDRLRGFMWAAKDGDENNCWLTDSCLNHANHYAEAIKFLFKIQ